MATFDIEIKDLDMLEVFSNKEAAAGYCVD